MNSSEIGGGVIITSEVDQNVFGIKHFHVPPQCLQDPVLEEDLVRKKYLFKSKCRAYLGANQLNIANITDTTVNLDTVDFDTGNDFDTVNHYFVAPRDGYYLIYGSLRWSSCTVNKLYYVKIFVNAAAVAINVQYANYTVHVIPVTDLQLLATGDQISLVAYHNTGAATPDLDGLQTYSYMDIAEVL